MLRTSEAFANDFSLESSTFFDCEVLVVLGKTGLSLLVHHQYKSDPHFFQTHRESKRERERERERGAREGRSKDNRTCLAAPLLRKFNFLKTFLIHVDYKRPSPSIKLTEVHVKLTINCHTIKRLVNFFSLLTASAWRPSD